MAPEGERQSRPTETEVTLVVVSDEPEEVTCAVAALAALDGLVLQPRPDEAIRDCYFDTPDGRLEAAHNALRIREVCSRQLLAIKGPARPGSRAGATRDELEEEWPEPAWALLCAELGHELGLELPEAPPAEDPVEALRSSGFVVVQERETSRAVRAVATQGSERPVAELDIDTVVFHLGPNDVRHHELEIEVKAPGGGDAVAALADSLVTRFEPSLRLWPHGKLSTGKAIAALIEIRGRDELLTGNGALRPSAYDAIAELLARDRDRASRAGTERQSGTSA